MDKVNQYTLIEFPDKSTDVVPDNWLFGQKCYWPKYTQEKLKVAVKRQEPVQAGWKLFEPVRLLKKCETLEKAQKMLKKYVDCDIHTSEITSDEEGHNERIKRKKRPNPRFLNFTENDSDQDVNAPKKSRLPAAPVIDIPESHMIFETSPAVSSLYSLENPHRVHQGGHQGSHQNTNTEAHLDTHYGGHQGSHQNTHNVGLLGTHYDRHQGSHQNTNNVGLLGTHYDRHQGSHQNTNNGGHLGTHYDGHQGSHQNTNNGGHLGTHYGGHQDANHGAHRGTLTELVNERYMNHNSSPTVSDIFSENPSRAQQTQNEHTNELSPFKRNVLKALLEIKAELKEQRAMIQKLQGVPLPQPEIGCSLGLPLQSLEDFDALERLDETEKNRLFFQLSLLGGHKLEDTVRKMLSHILTNNLASSFNWAGRGQKRSFETSNLSKIMFRALRSTAQGKEASKADFSEAVKKWLRYAPDRDGGSGRRSSVI